jgi:calcium-dependent protein kinase
MNQPISMSRKCTPLYASPQLLLGKAYSSKCDVWSLGVILYEMIFGTWPFFGKNEQLLL